MFPPSMSVRQVSGVTEYPVSPPKWVENGFPILGFKWVWVNTYRYIFSGMNIHLPAILGFTRYQGFDPSPNDVKNPGTRVAISLGDFTI